MSNDLIKWDSARRAIEEAHSIDEVKDIRDKAEAMRLYAKQQKESLEVQNMVAEIKLRCERRIGDMLKDAPKQHGARPSDTESQDVTPPTLEELGISGMQSSRWQTIANLPEAEFEKHIESTKAKGEELTTANVMRLAKKYDNEEMVTNVAAEDTSNPMVEENPKLVKLRYKDFIKELPQEDQKRLKELKTLLESHKKLLKIGVEKLSKIDGNESATEIMNGFDNSIEIILYIIRSIDEFIEQMLTKKDQLCETEQTEAVLTELKPSKKMNEEPNVTEGEIVEQSA